MTMTETNSEAMNQTPDSSKINEFVREGVEGAKLPPRPKSVVDAMENAFGRPIAEIDAMVLGQEAAQSMIQLEKAPKPERQPSWIKRHIDVLRGNLQADPEAGEAHPKLLVGLAVVALAGAAWMTGQVMHNADQHEQFAATATAKAEATQSQKDAIDKAATSYGPDEELLGTFTINKENPTVTQGIDNLDLKLDPANLNLGDFSTLQESGVAIGTVQPGDQIQVVKEEVAGKEVAIAERALPPAQPLNDGDTIPSPNTR